MSREIDKTADALDKRLHAMNNLQDQLDRQGDMFVQMTGKFVTRVELLAVASLISGAVAAIIVVVMHIISK